MPSVPNPARRRKSKHSGDFKRLLLVAVQFLISPLVLFCDAFQEKKNLDRSWLFSFFLLTTLTMALTGIGILITDGPLVKTMKMMASLSENQEVLSGDMQPVLRVINFYALQNNLDPNLIYALIKTESHFRADAVSPMGARGLMQIMPEVWRQYSDSACTGRHDNHKICHPENCIFVPEANIRVGTKYFRFLLDKYQGRADLALEAYNAGITNVQPGFAPKFEETRSYVQKINAIWQELRKTSLTQQLLISLRLQAGLKVLFGLSFGFWLILFWWGNRKLFPK